MIHKLLVIALLIAQRVRDFLAALFPPELRAYVPGRKLIAGLVAYVLVELLGVPAEASIEIPGLDVALDVQTLAAAIAVYMWPEQVPRKRRRRLRAEGPGLTDYSPTPDADP